MNLRSPGICRTYLLLILVCGLPAVAGLSYCAEVKQAVSPAIQNLSSRIAQAKPVEVDAIISGFIEEHRGDLPVIEDSLVTFIYKGKVALRVTVPSDLNGWNTKADEMTRLDNTDLYYLTLQLPLDARIDYKFYVDGMWMLDPLNDDTVTGGFGPNSAFSMPDYKPAPEIAFVDSLRHGKLNPYNFDSQIIPGTRKIQVYVPAPYEESPESDYPVVFVQDGGEYITLGSMVNVLDYAIAHGRIPPVVAVFINPIDRNYEYFLNQLYERMVIEEILPFVAARYDITSEPSRTAIMGASLGGAISVMIALDHPDVFGKCGSQSGAFEISDRELITSVASQPKKAVDFYMDCGTFDDLLESNRLMARTMEDNGYDLMYEEFNQGHSWGNWRDHIDDMLVFFWGER
jgi:enterochelin esterase-like enzyme